MTQKKEAWVLFLTSFAQQKSCKILVWLIIKLIMDLSSQVLINFLLQYIKTIANQANRLEHSKRKLSQIILQIEDYVQCFKHIDLDKKGAIFPNILQTFLIQNKYYYAPTSINRYFSKYSHEKSSLVYQDILEALLPHSDFIFLSHTISNSNTYSIKDTKNRFQDIKNLTSMIMSDEITLQNLDYEMMREITNNNLSIGATLWRLLDQNHDNTLNYNKIHILAEKFGKFIQKYEWDNFLYWHFHSYKRTINRSDFMRIIDIQEKKKRATSACKIDQYHIKNELRLKGKEQRLKISQINQTIQKKLLKMSNFTALDSKGVSRDEQFANNQLYVLKQLKFTKGYSVPKNTIKSVVQKYDIYE